MARSILEYLDQQCAVRPEAVALADAQQQITFAVLRRRAQAVATQLLARQVRGRPVGVVADHAAETVTLFLGVLYAGGFYVPLDPDLRPEKYGHIANDARFPVLLGTKPAPPLPLASDCRYLQCDEALLSGPVDAAALAAIAAERNDTDPMYLIYTSGSTGVPKGVLKDHGAMCSFAEAFAATYPLEPMDCLGNQTPFFFDASAKDICWMLRFGCRLEVLDRGLFTQPVNLVRRMNERKITVISWVPSALSLVSQLGTFQEVLPQTLRRVFFIGEVFPAKQFNCWRAALPAVQFVNLYGSSERAGACCHYLADAPCPADGVLPIGTAFPGTQVLLLDGDTVVTQPGQTGEICVVSRALASAYYHDAARTQAAFVRRQIGGVSVRLFHTGDLGRYDEAGQLVFATRRDLQIKHMGYRIELGEIEAAAGAIPGVQACACTYDAEKSRIWFFCEPVAGTALTKAALQKQLRARLPAYMAPNKLMILPALPRNANGKIDRQRLQALCGKGENHGRTAGNIDRSPCGSGL